MACTVPNIDELINLIQNREMAYEIRPEDTYEDIEKRFKHTSENVKLREEDHVYYAEGRLSGKQEFSTTATKDRDKILNKNKEKKEYKSDPIFAEAGTAGHKVFEKIIKGEPVGTHIGEWEIDQTVLNQIRDAVDSIKAYAAKRQKEIDPTKDFKIFSEQIIINPKKSRASTIDVIVVFSDKTAMVYDFKFQIVSAKDFDASGAFINTERLTKKYKEYEIQLGILAADVKAAYGVTDVIAGRAIVLPILIDSTYDKVTRTYKTKKKITKLASPFEKGSGVTQALLLTEKVKVKNIDNFLKDQFAKIRKLEKSTKQEDAIAAEQLRSEVEAIVINHDFSILVDNIRNLWEDYEKRKDEPKFLANGKSNYKYYTDKEAVELVGKIRSAADMFSRMGEYYSRMSKSSGKGKDLADKAKEVIGPFTQEITYMMTEMDAMVVNRYVAGLLGDNVLEDGELKMQREEGSLNQMFFGLSDQKNYFMRALNEIKLENERQVNEELEKFIKDWSDVNNSVNKWINTNGRAAFIKKLVNPKTKNLIGQLDKKFFDERSARKKMEDVDWFKKYYEPYITEEEFIARKNRFRETLKLQGLDKKKIDARMDQYDKNFNLWSTNPERAINAWTNDRAVKMKESLFSDKNWITKEYADIIDTPLGEFYNFYRKSMGNFLGMVDAPERANFIPWIRQGLVEGFLNSEGMSPKLLADAVLNSIMARNDSGYLSMDEGSKLNKEVPVYFMSPVLDDNGNPIPGEEKSMDLMHSLLIFGKMAMTHKAVKQRVGIANMLVEAYGNSRLYETTARGSLKRVGSEFATREVTAKEKEIAEALRDYHFYGIDMRSKDAIYKIGDREISRTEILRTLKSRWTMITLSFGLKQALGGYVAAKLNAWIDGSKGVHYSTDQFNNAVKLYYKEPTKMSALGLFMDIYSESVIERKLKAVGMDPADMGKFRQKDFIRTFKDHTYAQWWRNFNIDRMAMGVWRYEAESRDNALIGAVSQNFGVNKNNEFVRFKKQDFEKDGITLKQELKDQGFKQMYEIFEYDEKDGPRFNINATEQEKHHLYIRFREALKKIRNGISGEVSDEDKSYVNMTVWGMLIMQYRSWMPNILKERFGELSYDSRTMAAEQGRYRVAFKHLFQDTSKKDIPFTNLVLTGMARFGRMMAETTYIPSAVRSLAGKEKQFTPDVERLELEYKVWKEENPDLAEQISLEDYAEMRISQLGATIVEMRMIFGLIAFLLMLSAAMKADDDEEDEYALRFGYSIMRKAYSELSFTVNPLEYTRLTKNAIPLADAITRVYKAAVNTFDELRDTVYEEDSSYDRAEWFHYSKGLVPFGANVGRLLEWSEEDEKYLQEGIFENRF